MSALLLPSRYGLWLPHGLARAVGGLADAAIVAHLLFRADGGRASESVSDRRMAEYTGVPLRSVRAARVRLVEASFVSVAPRAGFGYVYTVHVPAVQAALDEWAAGQPPWLLGRATIADRPPTEGPER